MGEMAMSEGFARRTGSVGLAILLFGMLVADRIGAAGGDFAKRAENMIQGDPQGTLALAEAEFKRHPTSATALGFMARTMLTLGRLDDAEKALKRAQKIDPRNAVVQYAHAKYLFESGDYTGALEAFTAAGKTDPQFLWAFMNEGALAYQLEDFARSARAYQRASTLDRHNPRAIFGAGLSYLSVGTMDKAAAAFRQTLALNPDYPEAFLSLVSAYDALKDSKSIDAAFKAEIARLPNESATREAYVGWLLRADRKQEAAMLRLQALPGY